MSLPRPVIPGCDYMITRRCSERRFFLRPDDALNNAFLYCLILAAQYARVDLLFLSVMSNHYHAGIHDPHGQHPRFTRYLHSLLARCCNAGLGRFEHFWDASQTSAVRLVEPGDVLDKMVYAYSNPVAADLVDTAEQWPGLNTFRVAMTTGVLTARRPRHFFREAGEMPKTVRLTLARPQGFAELSDTEWRNLVNERVRTAEAEHRARRRREGKCVLGRKAIMRQSPLGKPSNDAERFGLSPRIAAKSKWARIEAIQRDRGFLAKYRSCIKAHLAGALSIVFPFGTYLMRELAQVLCEPPDTGPCDWVPTG